jgi:hypothetical protein
MSDPLDDRITLSPEAPHRMRRAEDRDELAIRARVWACFQVALAKSEPACDDGHAALMLALDWYKYELGILAVKRLGMTGVKP